MESVKLLLPSLREAVKLVREVLYVPLADVSSRPGHSDLSAVASISQLYRPFIVMLQYRHPWSRHVIYLSLALYTLSVKHTSKWHRLVRTLTYVLSFPLPLPLHSLPLPPPSGTNWA